MYLSVDLRPPRMSEQNMQAAALTYRVMDGRREGWGRRDVGESYLFEWKSTYRCASITPVTYFQTDCFVTELKQNAN